MENNVFGERLAILRKENQLTQIQLAQRLKQTESNIRKYEAGKAFPRVPGIVELANMFSVSTDYLLGLSDMRDGTKHIEKTVQEFSTDELLAEMKRRWNSYG